MNEALENLKHAYERFFKIQAKTPGFTKNTLLKCKKQQRRATAYEMNGHPKFKKKRPKKLSFILSSSHTYFKYTRKTHELIGLSVQKCGPIKIQTNYQIPKGNWQEQVKHIKRCTITYDENKWIFAYSSEKEFEPVSLRNFSIGIDLGIKKTAVISFGNQFRIFNNISKSPKVKHLEKQLRHYMRRLSKKTHNKVVNSKGALDVQKKIQMLYKKLSNIRKNYIHHITNEIVHLYPKSIILETLNVAGMVRNHYIAKATYDQMFAEFKRQILYKSEELNIKVILADPWYPSSKLCSNCGHKKEKLLLSQRVYKCECCGMIMDRDANAAKNLELLG